MEVPEGFDLDSLFLIYPNKRFVKFYKTIAIKLLADKVQISWTRIKGILQSTDAIGGTWSDIDGATSPYQVEPTEPQKFFRVKPE